LTERCTEITAFDSFGCAIWNREVDAIENEKTGRVVTAKVREERREDRYFTFEWKKKE
jgi:hypothetical protein